LIFPQRYFISISILIISVVGDYYLFTPPNPCRSL
jgi:hypothetical protein